MERKQETDNRKASSVVGPDLVQVEVRIRVHHAPRLIPFYWRLRTRRLPHGVDLIGVATEPESGMLLVAQGSHGINPGGPASGEKHGDDGRNRQEHTGCQEHAWIRCPDAIDHGFHDLGE